jgi:type III secretion protein D
MDRAPPCFESLQALELRVLAGPQPHARAPLLAGTACVLAIDAQGSREDAHIVLRDPRAAPARISIMAGVPHATVKVIEGEIQVEEHVLAAGQEATWHVYAPLCAGTTVIAFGPAGEVDWTACKDDAAEAAYAPQPTRNRMPFWLALVGAGVLLACTGVFCIAHVADTQENPPVVTDASGLRAALLRSEFDSVQVMSGANGRLTLSGRVPTQLQRKKLEEWLAARQVSAKPDILIDENIAHQIEEVFRLKGVAVKAERAAPGEFIVQAAEPDRARLARAEEAVHRDVVGVVRLDVQNSPAPLKSPAPRVQDDPGKRIVSLVSGEPAYVVGEDGARYFLGAMLPSGHRLTHIGRASITVERDGQQSTLNF